jgi:hypothetical protein
MGGGGGFFFLSANGKAQGALLFIPFKFGGQEGFFFSFFHVS